MYIKSDRGLYRLSALATALALALLALGGAGSRPALAANITVNTFADCSKNLLLVNFVQNH